MANESYFNHVDHKLNQMDLVTYEAVFPGPFLRFQANYALRSSPNAFPSHISACNHELYGKMSEARFPELPPHTASHSKLLGQEIWDMAGSW